MPTRRPVHEAVAEPVIYLIDRYVVGGFYRVHTGRGKDENLNAPGCISNPGLRRYRQPADEAANPDDPQPLLRLWRRRPVSPAWLPLELPTAPV